MGTVGARPKRKDPVLRPLDMAEAMGHLINPDPNKHYVGANKNDPFGIARYRMMGYEVEEYREGGVAPLAGLTNNPKGQIEIMDCVLMSVDRSVREEIDRIGQENANPIEQAIIKNRGQGDGLRAINPRQEWMKINNSEGQEVNDAI